MSNPSSISCSFLDLSGPLRVTDPSPVPSTPTTNKKPRRQRYRITSTETCACIERFCGQPDEPARPLALEPTPWQEGVLVNDLPSWSSAAQCMLSPSTAYTYLGSLHQDSLLQNSEREYLPNQHENSGRVAGSEVPRCRPGRPRHSKAVTAMVTVTRGLNGVPLTAGPEFASDPATYYYPVGNKPPQHGRGRRGRKKRGPVLHCIASDALARALVAATTRAPRMGWSCPVGHGRLGSVPDRV
ncbi:hypothetical protein LZ30DRAFT_42936 [Colletotrichum cereale]|nr:hypothetical protein LZ30DRAFT_42936 [Colletotrichum cereale]